MAHKKGTITTEQRTMFGSFMSRTTCPECNGKGKTFKEKCNKCRGTGKIKTNKDLEVKIPAGVDTGNQLRMSGKGEAGTNGGPNGDIYLEFNVDKHEIYERDGNDIYLELPLTIPEAVLGCKKDVPTIHGTVKLTIKEEREIALKYQKLKDEKCGLESQVNTVKFFDLKRTLQTAHENILEFTKKKKRKIKKKRRTKKKKDL